MRLALLVALAAAAVIEGSWLVLVIAGLVASAFYLYDLRRELLDATERMAEREVTR